jgi:hypothetical protein
LVGLPENLLLQGLWGPVSLRIHLVMISGSAAFWLNETLGFGA